MTSSLVPGYNMIKDQPGDSFFIQATFNRLINCSDPQQQQQLAFAKDDVLYVDNTMYNGVPGHWSAWLMDGDGNRSHWGIIPSKFKVEEELMLVKRRSLLLEGGSDGRGYFGGSGGHFSSGSGLLAGSTGNDTDDDVAAAAAMSGAGGVATAASSVSSGSSTRKSWANTRRSFFKRRKGGRSSSRDPSGGAKELASYSDVASLSSFADSLNLQEEALTVSSYVRVERLDCKFQYKVSGFAYGAHLMEKLHVSIH